MRLALKKDGNAIRGGASTNPITNKTVPLIDLMREIFEI